MRWEISGANRATGRDQTIVLEADDEASATRRGGRRGLLVERVRAVRDEVAVGARDADPVAAGGGDSVGFAYAPATAGRGGRAATGRPATRPAARHPRRRSTGAFGIAAVVAVAAAVAIGLAVFKGGNLAPADAQDRPAPVAPTAATATAAQSAPAVAADPDASQPRSQQASAAGPVPTSPTVQVSVGDLLAAYGTGPAAADADADADYKGRQVAVVGRVDEVGPNLFGTLCVTLKPATGPRSARRVSGTIDPARAATADGVRPGDTVTVVGRCNGLDGNVNLAHCRIDR